jgi:hypothetical protein
MSSREEYIDKDDYSFENSVNRRQKKLHWAVLVSSIILFIILTLRFAYIVLYNNPMYGIQTPNIIFALFAVMVVLFYYWYFTVSIYIVLFLDQYMYKL